MIQELLGGGSAPTGFIGDRKIISIPFSSSSTSPSPTFPSTTTTTPILAVPSTTTTTTTASTTTVLNPSNSSSGNNNSSEQPTQNLRCPRCDSTNTKFCYYNNYNLTQPRHFCKTCRRYWTKGGTLRNVPIGGGCRKNRSTSSSGSSPASGLSKSSNAMAKAKASFSTEMLVNGNPGFLGNGFMDHLHHHGELSPSPSPSPAFWPSLPQGHSSHILALLRGATTQCPNPNPSPHPTPITSAFTSLKSEGTPTLGLDPYGNGAPSPFGSFTRSNHHQLNGFVLGGPEAIPNGGNGGSNILELYQRLKSSSGYNENPGPVILGNGVGSISSSSAMNSTVLETAPPMSGGADNLGGYGIMSSGISCWSEFPTVPIHGAFP